MNTPPASVTNEGDVHEEIRGPRERSLSLSSFQGNPLDGHAPPLDDEEEDSLSVQLSDTQDYDQYRDFNDDSEMGEILSEIQPSDHDHMSANYEFEKNRTFSDSGTRNRKSSISQFQAVFDDLPETDAKKFYLLKQEIETLMAEKAMYRSNYEEICAGVERLQEENETLQDSVHRLQRENKSFKEASRKHSVQVQRQLNLQQKESSDNLATKEQIITQLKKTIDKLESELDFEKRKVISAQRDVQRRDMLLQNKTNQLRQRQSELEALNKQGEFDKRHIKDLKETVRSFRFGHLQPYDIIQHGERANQEKENEKSERPTSFEDRSTDAVVEMLREEIRQRDHLINSVNEESHESRSLLIESVQYLEKLLNSLCVGPKDASKYEEKTYQRILRSSAFVRSLRVFLNDESKSFDHKIDLYKSSRQHVNPKQTEHAKQFREKRKRTQVKFDKAVQYIHRNPLTKEQKEILSAPKLPILSASDKAQFEMKVEGGNLFDIAVELKEEHEQLFEVLIEEFVIASEEKPGLNLQSKSPEAQEAYELCVQLVEKMSFSENQRELLISSSDGSLPTLSAKDVQKFNLAYDNEEAGYCSTLLKRRHLTQHEKKYSYNFYSELKKLEAIDNELFDVFMEEHVAKPSKPLLVAKDVQHSSKRGIEDSPKRIPEPRYDPAHEAARIKILAEKRKKKEHRLMDLCKKIAHKIILDPDKRRLLEPCNGSLPTITDEQKAVLTAISKDKKEYNLYDTGAQLFEMNPELFVTFLEGATVQPRKKRKPTVPVPNIDRKPMPKAQSMLVKSPNKPQDLVVESAQVIHTGVTREEARQCVRNFFQLYADPENWRYSSVQKTTLYQFVFHNEVIEARFSFLYPLVIYLGQIIGVNKRCISYAALLAYGRSNKVITLSREMRTMIQTVEFHNNHHLWDYVFAILENAFKFHNQCYTIIGSRTSVKRR